MHDFQPVIAGLHPTTLLCPLPTSLLALPCPVLTAPGLSIAVTLSRVDACQCDLDVKDSQLGDVPRHDMLDDV
eukprot:3909199-Rhodomonas_salina.1